MRILYTIAKLTHYWTYSTQEVSVHGKDEAACEEIAESTRHHAEGEQFVKWAVIVSRQKGVIKGVITILEEKGKPDLYWTGEKWDADIAKSFVSETMQKVRDVEREIEAISPILNAKVTHRFV